MAQCPEGHVIHRDIAAPLNMLIKALEEKRVRDRAAEAIKEALSAVTIEMLEEWSRMLERGARGADPGRPMTLLNPVGGTSPPRRSPPGQGRRPNAVA